MIDINQSIKRLCRTKIIIPACLIIAMLIVLMTCPFLKTFHPTPINSIYDVTKDDSYVNVTADTLHYSGYNLTKPGQKTFGYYYALQNKHCIFVIIPVDSNPKATLTNYNFKAKIIKPNKSYNKMISAFSKDLNWNKTDLSAVTSGFVLSNADYHPIIYMILMWIVLIILFISLKNLISALLAITNPALYPVCTFLGKHEQKALIDDAQAELSSENYLQINSIYITENFFIDLGKSKISVIPLDEIVWCYRLGSVSLNPRIHKPEFALYFTIISGSVITCKHKTSDEALEAINAIKATGYPIIFGHSDSKRRRVHKLIARYKKSSL